MKFAGSLKLMTSNDAIEYIEECHSRGFRLLGVEGFIITEKGAFQPDQEASNDIADGKIIKNNFMKATISLINKYPNHWFEVVHSNEQKVI